MLDTITLIQALSEDDFDEARFRCERIVQVAWGDGMPKVGNAAMDVEVSLRAANLGQHVARDEAMAELVRQIETTVAPLRAQARRTP